jgi:bacteriorhodopsin
LRHRRPLRWIWYIFGFAFLAIEGYALYTKEKKVPTLSRTIWFLRDRHPLIKVVVVAIVAWLLFHLGAGEDAEDIQDFWEEFYD